VQFHINHGAFDGKRLLREDLAATMYTPPNMPAQYAYLEDGYALGVVEGMRNGAQIIYHGGGGFGFNTEMAWYPELKLGALVLTNAHQSDNYTFDLCQNVLDRIIASNIPLYRQRYVDARHVTPALLPDRKGKILTDAALQDLIRSKELPADAIAIQRRNAYANTYIISSWGLPGETFEISSADGVLSWVYNGTLSQYNPTTSLTEVKPGLFFSPSGSILDLRGPDPMIDNIRLIEANTKILPFQIAAYALCGLVFLSALLFWPARALFNFARRRNSQIEMADPEPKQNPWSVGISVLSALASLIGLFCLAIIALIPNMIYFPWPMPIEDFTFWQFLLLSLPFVSLALAIGVALIAGIGLKEHTGARATRWYYLIVSLVLLVFNGMILL
jgi:hypothetical protein